MADIPLKAQEAGGMIKREDGHSGETLQAMRTIARASASSFASERPNSAQESILGTSAHEYQCAKCKRNQLA